MANVQPTDIAAVLAAIDPDVTTASTVTTGWLDASAYDRFLAVVMAGTLGTNATVDAKIEQAQNASGTGAKDVTGKAITQLTQAGTDQSDKQALINLRQSDLDLANNFTHFRLSVTVGTATSDAGALVLGFFPNYSAPTQGASVEEVV